MFPLMGLLGSQNTVDLQNMEADETDESGSGADAKCRMYAKVSNPTRRGEQWRDVEGVLTLNNIAIEPQDNSDIFQMKWDALTGDPPDTPTVAEGVWHPLSSGNFTLEWSVPGVGNSSGSVTVSIRAGTGGVLDTAIWAGDADSSDGEG